MMQKMTASAAVAFAFALASGLAPAETQQEQAGQMMKPPQAGMMGHGGMGRDCVMVGGDAYCRTPGHMGPGMMAMMLIMMDANGDKALSLEEIQAVHARMFSYADADRDGKLTLEEMQRFMRTGWMQDSQ